MYRDLRQRSPIGLPLKITKSKVVVRYRTPIGLSLNLTQDLHKSLYLGLCRCSTPTQPAITAQIDALDNPRPSIHSLPLSCGSVRNVRLLAREAISHTFTPEDGLIPEPLLQGRMLLLTNLRVIKFGQKSGIRETVLVPLEEIKVVTVNAGHRSKGTLFQGGMMIMAAVLFYVTLAYWLTGRIDGPQVPIIRMDLVALVAFLAVLTGITVLAQMYFAKPDGEVMFQGEDVKFTFPFRGEMSEDEMYVLVNAAFAARQKLLTGLS